MLLSSIWLAGIGSIKFKLGLKNPDIDFFYLKTSNMLHV